MIGPEPQPTGGTGRSAGADPPRDGELETEIAAPCSRRPLSRARIVDAALSLACRKGIAGLSMRRLGEELGVKPMSLYYYVPSKTSLIVQMADRSVSLIPQPDPAWPWQRQLVDLLVQTFEATVENPALFLVLAAEPLHRRMMPAAHRTSGSAMTELLERILVLLEAGRIPTVHQATAFRCLVAVVVGFAAGQSDGFLPLPPPTDGPAADEPELERIAPLLTSLRPALQSTSTGKGVRFGLELIVQGLAALARPPTEY